MFGFEDGDFDEEGATTWEIKNPNRTMNGNARMKSTMSRLRVLVVMLQENTYAFA